MKLIRFGDAGTEKPGVLIGNARRDCSAHFSDWDRPFLQGNGLVELRALLDGGADDLPCLVHVQAHRLLQ